MRMAGGRPLLAESLLGTCESCQSACLSEYLGGPNGRMEVKLLVRAGSSCKGLKAVTCFYLTFASAEGQASFSSILKAAAFEVLFSGIVPSPKE